MLTKTAFLEYNSKVKGDEEKSMLAETFSEPGLVRAGTAEAAEHGLGAGVSIGRHSRVRPLLREEADFFCETRWYRVNFVALGVFQGRFFFLGGNSYE